MSTAANEIVLSAQGLVMRFGGITATNNVTLKLQRGARHALIGPNGAGKTTLINLLTGVLEPTAGRITLEGQDITALAPHQRVRRGMVRTFQINQLFDSLTPLETLALTVSQHQGLGGNWWPALGSNASVNQRCEELLEQFHLTSVMNQSTKVLAYGKRRLLEIAIALACAEPEIPGKDVWHVLGAVPVQQIAIRLPVHPAVVKGPIAVAHDVVREEATLDQ